MANHSLPTTSTLYADFVTQLDARFDDIAVGFNPQHIATVNVTNPPNGSIMWDGSQNKWKKYNGTNWDNDLAVTYSISISGNAATVTNGVVTSGTYANPSWITSLAGSKITGDISGGAATATRLATPRAINGTNFDGTGPITTSSWGTSRTLTIGNTGKAVDGSAGITWSLAEIGAGDVFTTSVQTLTNKSLTSPTFTGEVYNNGSVRLNITPVAALDINCSLGNYFTKTISANSTFTFSNAPSSRAYGFTLELTHTSGSVTWPTAVRWPGNTAPTLTSGKTHLFMFVTDDGGTTWRGVSAVDYNN